MPQNAPPCPVLKNHLAAASAGFRGVIGVARMDITPPIGIHARCWGAAKHDVPTGVHRPLTLTTITFERHRLDTPLVLMSADLMSWRSRDAEAAVIGKILEESRLPRENLMFCLTHTHAAPSVRREDADKPGGALIEAYQQQLVRTSLGSIREAQVSKCNATLTWAYGRCDLAANRDFAEPGGSRVLCGFNPEGQADDTLLVGRICDDTGKIVATIVNYACHPTTLAWENTLLSPDFVGAMREGVETHAGSPCLFLQGVSGELAPAEQYVGDPSVADRHGRRLGFAVLSTLEGMAPPGTQLKYQGVMESGAPLAMWRPEKVPASTTLSAKTRDVELPLKPMPSARELEEHWRACDDPVLKERLWRKLGVRRVVGDGETSPMPLFVWRLGDACLVGQPNEAYSQFQIELRRAFPDRAIAVMNLVNGSAGYLPPSEMYDRDCYQVTQSPFSRGSLENLIQAATRIVAEMNDDPSPSPLYSGERAG